MLLTTWKIGINLVTAYKQGANPYSQVPMVLPSQVMKLSGKQITNLKSTKESTVQPGAAHIPTET